MAHPHEPLAEAGRVEAWRRRTEEALRGRAFSSLQTSTRDGIVIDPLYPKAARPVLPGRGVRPWRVVQIVDGPDPDQANQGALEGVRGGVTGLALRFSGDTVGSALPATREALYTVLDGIDFPAVHVRIEPAPAGPKIAGWMRDLVARRGLPEERAEVSFGLGLTDATEPASAEDLSPLLQRFVELREAGFAGRLPISTAASCMRPAAARRRSSLP
jgi:methylmalonyl-CoA mutase